MAQITRVLYYFAVGWAVSLRVGSEWWGVKRIYFVLLMVWKNVINSPGTLRPQPASMLPWGSLLHVGGPSSTSTTDFYHVTFSFSLSLFLSDFTNKIMNWDYSIKGINFSSYAFHTFYFFYLKLLFFKYCFAYLSPSFG